MTPAKPVCVVVELGGRENGYNVISPVLTQIIPTAAECTPIFYEPIPIRYVDGDFGAPIAWSIPVVFTCEGSYPLQVRSAGFTPHADPIAPGSLVAGVTVAAYPPLLDALLPLAPAGPVPLPPQEIFNKDAAFGLSPLRLICDGQGHTWLVPADDLSPDTHTEPVPARHIPQIPGTLLSVHSMAGFLVAVTDESVFIANLPHVPYLGVENDVEWKPMDVIWPDAAGQSPVYRPVGPGSMPGAPSLISRTAGARVLVAVRRTDSSGVDHTALLAVHAYAGVGPGGVRHASCDLLDGSRLFRDGTVHAFGGVQVDVTAGHGLTVDYVRAMAYLGIQSVPAWTAPIAVAVPILDMGIQQRCATADPALGACVDVDPAVHSSTVDVRYFIFNGRTSQAFIILADGADQFVYVSDALIPSETLFTLALIEHTACGGPWKTLGPLLRGVDEAEARRLSGQALSTIGWTRYFNTKTAVPDVAPGQPPVSIFAGAPTSPADCAVHRMMVVPRSGHTLLFGQTALISTNSGVEMSVLLTADEAEPDTAFYDVSILPVSGVIVMMTKAQRLILIDPIVGRGLRLNGHILPTLAAGQMRTLMCNFVSCASLVFDSSSGILAVEHEFFPGGLFSTSDTDVATTQQPCAHGKTAFSGRLGRELTRVSGLTTLPIPYALFVNFGSEFETHFTTAWHTGPKLRSLEAADLDFLDAVRALGPTLYFTEPDASSVKIATTLEGGNQLSTGINFVHTLTIDVTALPPFMREFDYTIDHLPFEMRDAILTGLTDSAAAVPALFVLNPPSDSVDCPPLLGSAGPAVGAHATLFVYMGCTTGVYGQVDFARSTGLTIPAHYLTDHEQLFVSPTPQLLLSPTEGVYKTFLSTQAIGERGVFTPASQRGPARTVGGTSDVDEKLLINDALDATTARAETASYEKELSKSDRANSVTLEAAVYYHTWIANHARKLAADMLGGAVLPTSAATAETGSKPGATARAAPRRSRLLQRADPARVEEVAAAQRARVMHMDAVFQTSAAAHTGDEPTARVLPGTHPTPAPGAVFASAGPSPRGAEQAPASGASISENFFFVVYDNVPATFSFRYVDMFSFEPMPVPSDSELLFEVVGGGPSPLSLSRFTPAQRRKYNMGGSAPILKSKPNVTRDGVAVVHSGQTEITFGCSARSPCGFLAPNAGQDIEGAHPPAYFFEIHVTSIDTGDACRLDLTFLLCLSAIQMGPAWAVTIAAIAALLLALVFYLSVATAQPKRIRVLARNSLTDSAQTAGALRMTSTNGVSGVMSPSFGGAGVRFADSGAVSDNFE